MDSTAAHVKNQDRIVGAMNESDPAVEGVQEALSTSEDGVVEASKESIPTQASAETKKEDLTSVPHPEVPVQPEAHPAPESEALQEAKEPHLPAGEPIPSLNETKEIVSAPVESAKETDHPPLPHQDVDQTLPPAPAVVAPESAVETDHTPLPHQDANQTFPPASTSEAPESAMETDNTVTPHPEASQTLPPTPAFEAPETAKEELVPTQSDVIMTDASVQQNQEQSLPDEPLEEDQASVASLHVGSSVALSVDTGGGDFDSDTDSALGDPSLYTTSTSVKSNVYQFVEENGRTYHAYREGKYFLPNDESEQDRLDMQHQLFLLTFGGLHKAPIKDLPGGLHNVLDIATGTGIWAIEFATQFPQSKVIATDLSPIQPEFVPPNCQFEIDDAEDPWLYSHQFDYIHGRALASCFKSHQPVINSAFAFTRPGGYLELQDFILPFRWIDDSYIGTATERWCNLTIEGTTRLGKDWTRVGHYKEYLKEAGFEDIVEEKYEWPVGTWAKGKKQKTLGLWYREDLLQGLHAFSAAVLTRAMGMTLAEIEMLLMEVREEIKSNRIHIYLPVRVVYGRKPLGPL